MTFSTRRLGPGDETILGTIAREDADFDIDDRGEPRVPLDGESARAYLADPAVLHWVVEEGGVVLGHMYCHALRKHAGDPMEVLLYEIGVRGASRRRGVGRGLMDALGVWMAAHQVKEVWVLADNPGAVEFYRACGLEVSDDAVTYMTRRDP